MFMKFFIVMLNSKFYQNYHLESHNKSWFSSVNAKESVSGEGGVDLEADD